MYDWIKEFCVLRIVCHTRTIVERSKLPTLMSIGVAGLLAMNVSTSAASPELKTVPSWTEKSGTTFTTDTVDAPGANVGGGKCDGFDAQELFCSSYCAIVQKRGRTDAEKVFNASQAALACNNPRNGFQTCGC